MSSISAIGSSSATTMLQGARAGRPDPSEMATNLFSRLDTSGRGFLQKSDLQSAFDKISTASSSASSVDDLFAQLDGNSDGKVTKQEFSDLLRQLSEQLDNQAMRMRMESGASAGAALPPPPAGDSGFTTDELTAQLDEIGSSDSKRSALISEIVNNFDAADTDGDGKVSFKEAMAYDQAKGATATSTSGTASSASSASGSASDRDVMIMRQIVRLMEAYGLGDGSEKTGAFGFSAIA